MLSLVLDAMAINVAIVVAFVLRFGWSPPAFNFDAYQRIAIPLTAAQLLILFLVDLYEPTADRSGPEILATVAKGVTLGISLLVVLSFFFRAFSFPRLVIVMSLFLQILFLWGWRKLGAVFLHVKWPERRVLIIGSMHDAQLVAERLRFSEPWGYKVAGLVVEDAEDASELPRDYPFYVGPRSLTPLLESLRPHQVIVATPARHRQILEEIAVSPHFDGEIYVVPQLYEMHLGEVNFSLLGDLPLLRLTRSARPSWQQGLKAVTEVLVAVVLLVLALPLLVAVFLAVLLSSGWPVIYRQERAGKDLKPFTIYKFRTMVRNAEADGVVLAEEDDPRVTGVGKVLRVSRLDELPQLVNVARGEMSLVGPRPERPEFVAEFMAHDPLYVERFRVRPGITGLAQVSASYATTAPVKLRFDLMYIYHQSLALDLRILLGTIRVVLSGRGAL